MITNDFKREALNQLENMTVEELRETLELIGSERVSSSEPIKDVGVIISEELERYGIHEGTMKYDEECLVERVNPLYYI